MVHSLGTLLLVHSVKLDQLCESLQLPAFTDVEIAFIKEDTDVFCHLAQGLDRLQGDLNPESYMGFLFPTLFQLQHTYEQLSQSTSLKYCGALASAILIDINTRFSPYFTFADATQSSALASITHPAFKLRWIKPSNVEQMKNLFLNTLRFSCERDHQRNAIMPSRTDEVVDSKTLDFFTFMVMLTASQNDNEKYDNEN